MGFFKKIFRSISNVVSSLFGGGGSSSPAPVPTPVQVEVPAVPTAPDVGANADAIQSEVDAQKKKQQLTGLRSTVFTSALGLSNNAPVARRTLLGG